ncbi:hypothetical protein ACHAXA_002312 [Cyclostephanos tholiformis]|uniref:Uncharacterized protein n=1 Tax=Cyclostephanos tholiformis TaxID=382380 RepID=A0ABD3SS72_9STRA
MTMEKEALISIPRTAKSSSSVALPSLLSGIPPPPPPSQPPVPKIQSRQGGPQPHQMPQQPQRHLHPQQQYHQLDYHYNLQGGAQNGNQPPQNHIAQRSPSATDFARPFSSSSQLPQCFPPTIKVNAEANPLPLPPLSDVQKKTLRHLDTLVEVVLNKIVDQVELNKKMEANSTDPSGGIGIGSREYKRQREQQGNVDVFGSFITNEDNRYDFFDTDPMTNTILVPPLPNRSIPIFPEDFPPGKKEWPLSWWGICQPSPGLLALHENMANDLGFPIKKRGVPSTKKDAGRDSIDDFTRGNESLGERNEKTSSREDRSGRESLRDDRRGTRKPDGEQSSEHDRRSSSDRKKERARSDSRRERTSSDSRNHESRRRKEPDLLTNTELRKRERSNSDSRRSRDSSKHKRHHSGDCAERSDVSRRDDNGRQTDRGNSSHRGESRSREKSHRGKNDKDKEYRKRSTHKITAKVGREVAAKKLLISRIIRTIHMAKEVNIAPKAKREAIEGKVTSALITEDIEMNVAKEMFLEKCVNAALVTNIPIELVTDRMIVGRDRSERGLEAIDGPNFIMEIIILPKDISEEFTLETGTPMWVSIVVVIAPTLTVRFPMDLILEISEIGKSDFAMRTCAGTFGTEEANGVMRDTETTIV